MPPVEQALIGLVTVEALSRGCLKYLLTFYVSDKFCLRSWIGTMSFIIGVMILLWPQIVQRWSWCRVCRRVLELVDWCSPWLAWRLLWTPGHHLIWRLLQNLHPGRDYAARSLEMWFQLVLGIIVLVYAIKKALKSRNSLSSVPPVRLCD